MVCTVMGNLKLLSRSVTLDFIASMSRHGDGDVQMVGGADEAIATSSPRTSISEMAILFRKKKNSVKRKLSKLRTRPRSTIQTVVSAPDVIKSLHAVVQWVLLLLLIQ